MSEIANEIFGKCTVYAMSNSHDVSTRISKLDKVGFESKQFLLIKEKVRKGLSLTIGEISYLSGIEEIINTCVYDCSK
jgi:hypothetical protein